MSVFAGFAKSLTAESPSKGNGGKPKSQHEIFISMQVLPLTIKLQKEMRGRRYTVRTKYACSKEAIFGSCGYPEYCTVACISSHLVTLLTISYIMLLTPTARTDTTNYRMCNSAYRKQSPH
jgi:hypothetical protein